eukprot:350868-Chlamydomonas_euryale.AAC.11
MARAVQHVLQLHRAACKLDAAHEVASIIGAERGGDARVGTRDARLRPRRHRAVRARRRCRRRSSQAAGRPAAEHAAQAPARRAAAGQAAKRQGGCPPRSGAKAPTVMWWGESQACLRRSATTRALAGRRRGGHEAERRHGLVACMAHGTSHARMHGAWGGGRKHA